MSGLSALPLQVVLDPIWFVAAAAAVVLLVAVGGPVVVRSLRSHRPPTAAEADALATRLAAAAYEPSGVAVRETGDDGAVAVSIRGLPGRRRLVVTDEVLSGLDDDTAGALLAAEVERARHYYLEYRAVASAAVVALATAMFSGLLSVPNGVVVLALAALVLFWLGRQLQFSADRVAAERVGAVTTAQPEIVAGLADTFEAVAARRGVDPEPASWRTLFEVQPPLGQRIDRLRASE